MREYITSDDICNQISMERSVFKGTFLVVEGVTDERLFEKFIDKDEVRIIEAHSKDNVRHSVKDMSSVRRDTRVIGIIDPDLDRLRGRKTKPPLFFTDCRDMEMMIIRSNALQDVLDEYCDQELLAKFTETVGPVREALVSASYPLGLLMYVSQMEGLNLSFKDLEFERFINPRTLSLNAGSMVDTVIFNSKNCRMSRKAILSRLDREAQDLEDQWDAARGHDTVNILLIALKKNFGSFNSRGLNEGELGGALRLAFSDQCFSETDLYRNTRQWAADNGVRLWELVSPDRTPLL